MRQTWYSFSGLTADTVLNNTIPTNIPIIFFSIIKTTSELRYRIDFNASFTISAKRVYDATQPILVGEKTNIESCCHIHVLILYLVKCPKIWA